MTDKPPTCETCRFWIRGQINIDSGACRRYPPAAQDTTDPSISQDRVWPIVLSVEWCGEHQPQESDDG